MQFRIPVPLASLRSAALATLTALALTCGLPGGALAEDAPFAGADTKARLEAVDKALTTDVDKALNDLMALGASKEAGDLELLLELSIRSNHRIVRILAQGAIREIDKEKGLAWFRKHADATDRLKTVYSIEGIQRLGTDEDVAKLTELAGNADVLIAAAALRALPRLVKKKQLDAVVDTSLRHTEVRMSDYGAWCVQDVLKKQASAVKVYAKIAKKKKDDRSLRAESVIAVLEDDAAPPHKWGDDIKLCQELVKKAPKELTINARNSRHRAKAEKAVEWMKENVPVVHFVLRASAVSLDVPGQNPDGHIDLEKDIALVPLTYTGHNERQLAYHLSRVGGVLFQKRIGNPYTRHRGWELPIFDSYDVCVVAKLYDAGPSGLPRRRFVSMILDKRPWDGT